MEKTKRPEQKFLSKLSSESRNRVIWDCGSSLYDSFELKAFEKQLDSAISSRTLSMPHLSDRRLPPPPLNKKPTSKISRSFRKLIRSFFRPKSCTIASKDGNFRGGFGHERPKEGFYIVYDRPPGLSTIPEIPEFDGMSPEIKSLVRRSASERFTAASSIGISCS